jgi:hypothetical protein
MASCHSFYESLTFNYRARRFFNGKHFSEPMAYLNVFLHFMDSQTRGSGGSSSSSRRPQPG